MTFSEKNPSSTLAARLLCLLVSCALAAWGQEGHRPLPIYFEDNHAGTFHFLATSLDLTQPCTLVLVDAHSDSSRPGRMETLIEGIRRVGTPEERENRIRTWRRNGTMQAFDWILPLMPRPVSKVIWVRPNAPRTMKAREPLPPGFVIGKPGSFETKIPRDLPVAVSIDLDYFGGLPASKQSAEFLKLWTRILRIPRLCAISFAVSRPWLSDDAEASRLLFLALNGSLSLAHTSIRFEPFGIEGPDHSERAKTFYRKRRVPPRFDPESVSPELRSLLLANAPRLEVKLDPARWQDLLERWRSDHSDWHIAMEGTEPCSDGIYRPATEVNPTLRIEGGPPGLIHHVNWVQWTPKAWSYNVLPELLSGKAFAGVAPPVMDYQATLLARTDSLSLPAEVWMPALPGQGKFGVLRLSAHIGTEGGPAHTARIEIRRAEGIGFHAGLSEQFGLPYVFGAGYLRKGQWRGPDTGVGNDCANFLVYAWRRSGLRMPWCNPTQLKRHLTVVADRVQVMDRIAIPKDEAARGLAIHMGSHVAAFWEDREPFGTLGPEDLVVHHLGAAPEVIPLRDLLDRRKAPSFDVYLGPSREPVGWIAVGGDLMPGEDSVPPKGLKDLLAKADVAVANLEASVGREGQAARKRYVFQIPTSRLPALRALGIHAFSLANNHAGDFGAEGLEGTLRALDTAGFGHFGGGADVQSAVSAWYTRVKDLTVAFVGLSLVDPKRLPAGAQKAGVAVLPKHYQEILESLANARKKAQCVIVLPHWGEEGTTVITEEQRQWAYWLIEHGADAVVGSGPHVVQMHETIDGAPVLYSMGNLWFQGEWPKESRKTGMFFLGLDGDGRIVQTKREFLGASSEEPSGPEVVLR